MIKRYSAGTIVARSGRPRKTRQRSAQMMPAKDFAFRLIYTDAAGDGVTKLDSQIDERWKNLTGIVRHLTSKITHRKLLAR